MSTRPGGTSRRTTPARGGGHSVAAQVDIWKKAKVCNRLLTMGQGAGSRAGTGRFQAVGQLDLTCTGSPPQHQRHARVQQRDGHRAQVAAAARGHPRGRGVVFISSSFSFSAAAAAAAAAAVSAI
jgi:hypothetical protein